MRNRVAVTVGVMVALSLLSAGCSTGPRGPEVTASAAELGRDLNPACPEGSNLIGAFDLVTGVDDWIHAVKVEGDRNVTDARVPIEILDAEGNTTEARLYGASWRGLDWGLDNGADVWIGTSTLVAGNVRLVMVVTPTQEVFFSGECSDAYRQFFYDALGDRAGELLAGLPSVDPRKAYDHLGLPDPYAPEEPSDPEHVILNAENVDPATLGGLHGIELQVAITDVVGDGSPGICTKIEAGWNDCVQADADAVAGLTIPVWADESGQIEFWLLDRDGNVAQPLGRLGKATAVAKHLAVRIDTSGIAADGSFSGDDRVYIVD